VSSIPQYDLIKQDKDKGKAKSKIIKEKRHKERERKKYWVQTSCSAL